MEYKRMKAEIDRQWQEYFKIQQLIYKGSSLDKTKNKIMKRRVKFEDQLLAYYQCELVDEIREISDRIWPNNDQLEDEVWDWYLEMIKKFWPDWHKAHDIIYEFEEMMFYEDNKYYHYF